MFGLVVLVFLVVVLVVFALLLVVLVIIVVDDLPLTKQIHTPPTLTLTTTRRTARVIQHQLPPPQHRLVILAAQTKHLPLPILIIRADILVILLVHALHFLQRLNHRPAEVEREIVPVVVARGVPAGFARVLGSGMLWMELLPVVVKWTGLREARRIVKDGLVRSASTETEVEGQGIKGNIEVPKRLGWGVKLALAVAAMNWWMLLMTAAYFHTWFEKFTGLIVASTALYAIYFLPRAVQLLRQAIGMPGV